MGLVASAWAKWCFSAAPYAPGTGGDRTIRYTADGKAHEIQLGSGQTTRFWYGPDGQRYKRTDGTTTTYYVGGVEVVVQNGVSTARRYVAGGRLSGPTGQYWAGSRGLISTRSPPTTLCPSITQPKKILWLDHQEG